VNKEPFEKRFEKFITSKINTLRKGNISPKELFLVFVSRIFASVENVMVCNLI